MHVSPILKDKLLIGSCPITAGDVEQLKALGITAVLNLQTDEDLQQRDIDWPAMTDAYHLHRLEIRRFPIADFSPQDMRQKLRARHERAGRPAPRRAHGLFALQRGHQPFADRGGGLSALDREVGTDGGLRPRPCLPAVRSIYTGDQVGEGGVSATPSPRFAPGA